MRQTTRTNNAAVVADGAVKPTSVLSVTRVEQSLQVVAHLSEGVRRFWLLDSTALEEFVDAELRYGLGVALEAKILSDINGTSGIQAQAYATSVLATVRKGITKLETAGYSPDAIVLHPSDFEGIELALASTSAIEARVAAVRRRQPQVVRGADCLHGQPGRRGGACAGRRRGRGRHRQPGHRRAVEREGPAPTRLQGT